MNIFLMVLFYTFASSVIFGHGIGLERLLIYSENKNGLCIFILKTLILLSIAVSLLWNLNIYILIPLGLYFILTIFAIITVLNLEIFVNIFLKKLLEKKAFFANTPNLEEKETVFSYGLLFFVLYEAGSYIEALTIIAAACIGLFIFSHIFNAIKQKTDLGNAYGEAKEYPLLLIGAGFLMIAFYVTDISWFFDLF